MTFSECAPSVVGGNSSGEPLSGCFTGEPNASTWPSRVPTYRRPSPTPGVPNFTAVPIGALQRSGGLPSTGTGSYARSCAPSPPPFGIHSVHTSAEPAVVPAEVITGAPEPKPKASDDSPASDSAGEPPPETPYL